MIAVRIKECATRSSGYCYNVHTLLINVAFYSQIALYTLSFFVSAWIQEYSSVSFMWGAPYTYLSMGPLRSFVRSRERERNKTNGAMLVKHIKCRRRLYRPRRGVSRGQLKQTDNTIASDFINRRNKRVGMSHKRRCNLATKAKKRHNVPCLIEIKRRLGPINSSFEGIRKSVHYVHPRLLNHNHLVISNKIHEKHVAILETNGEVTTLFGGGSRARV